MLRLSLLGTVDLVGPDRRSLNGDVGGAKPLALLVYLVLEGTQRPVRRDTVATLLWPESEQKKARASLSQALLQLRNALGDVVISGGQELLSVDRAQITSDCFEFAELASTGRLDEAAALYRGDVAAGLYVKEAPEFDDWLSRQQTSWRERYATVLLKLFRAAIDSNDLPAATNCAEKLIDVAPDKDEPVRTLLPLLIARGQAPVAKRVFDTYARRLAELYDVQPDAEIAALVANLPPAQRSPNASRVSTTYIADPAPRPRRSMRAPVIAVAILLAVILVGTRWYDVFRAQGSLSALETSTPKVAVLPFAYSGSAQRSASVLNEALQWRLRNVGFDVLNAGSQDTAAVRKLIATNGQAGTMFVVGGDVETQPDQSLHARLWLKDAASGKRVWESRFTQPQEDAHLIATQLSDAVTAQIRRAAGDALELVSRGGKVSSESWKQVYRARERMEAGTEMRRQGAVAGSATEIRDAELTLVEVSKREPDWALPWILRGRLAEARAVTALIAGDPRKGAAELDRGIRMLDSVATRLDSEDIYDMRGLLQYRRYMFGVEDVAAANRLLTRAEADLRKAFSSGRDHSGSYTTLSGVMFAQGKYAESFVYARRAYDSNVFLRNNEDVLTRLFNSALHAGDDAAADHWCKELQLAQPGKWPAVLCRVHIAGFAPHIVDVNTLEREIENLVAAPPIRQVMAPRLKAAYAITLAQVGQTDRARAMLASVAGSQDPEVQLFSAFALAALKDASRAHAVLRSYLAEHRGTRSTALHMRWLN